MTQLQVLMVVCLCGLGLPVVSALPGCPRQCRCTHSETDIVTVCNQANLTFIPEAIDHNTKELILNENLFPVLEQHIFNRFSKLRTLIIRHCQIRVIESNAFEGLTELKELDLKWNNLRSIESYAFSNLPNLRILRLDNNNIESIYNFAFNGLKLTLLSLEVNPNLVLITHEAFLNSSVQQLSFYNSSLKTDSLESLRTLKDSLQQLSIVNNREELLIAHDLFVGFTFQTLKLEYLNISFTHFLRHLSVEDLSFKGSSLTFTDLTTYESLQTTRVLRLDETQLNYAGLKSFQTLNNLEELHLNNNNIQTIPENMKSFFSNLRLLSLKGNPLHCNCLVSWFHRWLRSTSVLVYGARCNTPMSLDLELMSSSDFVCTHPHILALTKNINVAFQHSAAFTCEAFGDPAPTVFWRTINAGFPYGSQTPPDHLGQLPGRTKGVLTIPFARKNDSGTYKCVAINLVGNSTHEASLIVSHILPQAFSTGTIKPQIYITILILYKLLVY